jgi:phospholipid/cholesterol/gamma-HCH transport system ATP-binding protein
MTASTGALVVEHEVNYDGPVVALEHLKKSFGENHVLLDINLEMHKGENLVILGQSGTGKSVLIKCIVGLLEPDEGNILLFGRNTSDLNAQELGELRLKIGFLFQSSALYDSMTVRENLEFPLRRQQRSLSQEDMDALVEEALKNVGLADAIEKTPSEISGGMRKRLGLARTLILKPAVMLYDEPTTGLDPITSKEISTLILEVQQAYTTSSIIITHDIECARRTANRIIMINDGICVAEGTYDDLKKSHDTWIRSFLE